MSGKVRWSSVYKQVFRKLPYPWARSQALEVLALGLVVNYTEPFLKILTITGYSSEPVKVVLCSELCECLDITF
jgi:hypothetical protein